MNLAREHREMLGMLEKGVVWTELTVEQQEAVHHLEKFGLAGARVDIADDLWMITQEGKIVWEDLQARDEQTKKEADEHAQQKRQQRFENKIAILNTVIPVITFILGLFVGNVDRIASVCVSIWEWIVSLF